MNRLFPTAAVFSLLLTAVFTGCDEIDSFPHADRHNQENSHTALKLPLADAEPEADQDVVRPAEVAEFDGTIEQVMDNGNLRISGRDQVEYEFQTAPVMKIMIDGRRADLQDLAPGDGVHIKGTVQEDLLTAIELYADSNASVAFQRIRRVS